MSWGRQIPPPGTPLNRGLEIVRSIAGIWPFTERGGLTSPDLIGGGGAGPEGRWTAVVPAAAGGYSLAASGHFEAPSSPRFDGTYGTLSFFMRTSQGANFILLMARADSNSRNGLSIFTDSASSVVRIQAYQASSVIQDISGTTNVRDGNKHHVAVTWDRTLNGQNAIYVDGKQEVTAFNTGAWSFNGQVVRGGLALDTFWSQLTGELDLPIWFNRILFPGEIRQLAQDPYYMFYKPRRRIMFVPAAGGTGNPRLVNGGLVNTGCVGGGLAA